MALIRLFCPLHPDEDIVGTGTSDGMLQFTCDRRNGHPGGLPYSWLHDPMVVSATESGLGGLADELDLAHELPAALASLGRGWFEYGLVERAYALAKPDDFQQMIDRWGHTTIAPKKYTCSSYIAGVLGGLARAGAIAYHDGKGTGRWSYNSNISYWALEPQEWLNPTTWVSVVGDNTPQTAHEDVECKRYVGA